MATLHKLVLSLILATLTACAHSAESRETAVADTGNATAAPAPSLTCASDADCVVKDIGSCCGYFPACVHRDQAVDPLAVRQRCIEQGLQSICGFVEITSCACAEGTCRAGAGALE